MNTRSGRLALRLSWIVWLYKYEADSIEQLNQTSFTMSDLAPYTHFLSPSGLRTMQAVTQKDSPRLTEAVAEATKEPCTAKRLVVQAQKEVERPTPHSNQTERIMLAMLRSSTPLDLPSMAGLTGIGRNELSWRLLSLVQHARISRRKETLSKKGERFIYFLTTQQRDAAMKVWGEFLDAPMPAAHLFILQALYRASSDLDIGAIATETKLSTYELSWRLARMVRQDLISRRKCAKSSETYRYFLREEQREHLESWCETLTPRAGSVAPGALDPAYAGGSQEDHAQSIKACEAELEQVRKRKDLLQRQMSELRARVAQDEAEIRAMETQLAEDRARAAAMTVQKEGLIASNSHALARAQANPVVLAERLAFIQRLRSRPALEPLAGLREIEVDYRQALAIARGT